MYNVILIDNHKSICNYKSIGQEKWCKELKYMVNFVNYATTIIAIIIVLHVLYGEIIQKKAERYINNENYNWQPNEKQMRIFVCILLVCATALRMWKLGQVPEMMNQDSALAAIEAKALWLHGTDRFGMRYPVYFVAWGFSQMSVLMSYLMIPFFELFGMSELTIRIPCFFMSVIGLAVLYLLCKKIFGKMSALVILALAAVNPWHFAQSRWALDANLLPHFFILGVFFLCKGIKLHKYLYVSMVFFALCHYCYAVSLYIVPLYLLILSIYYLHKKAVSIKQVLVSLCIYLLISLPFYVAMLINTFGYPTIETPWFTIPYCEASTRMGDVLFFSSDIAGQLVRNIKAFVSLVVFQDIGKIWHGVPGFGTMYYAMVPFTFVGIYAVYRLFREKVEKREEYMAIIVWGIVSILAGIVTFEVNVNRINIIHYVQIILIGLGIHYTIKKCRKASILIGGCVLLLGGVYVGTYFTSYAEAYRADFRMDFRRALEAVKEKDCGKYYITPITDDPQARTVSEIDAIYIHDLDIPYIQGKTSLNHGSEEAPYKEKYRYVYPEELVIDAKEDAVYIILTEDEGMFPKESFYIEHYGAFGVVSPLEADGEQNTAADKEQD